jgi:hypothetical protein
MPYVSQAQRRKFHADPKLAALAAKWDALTKKGAKLPEHVKPKKRKKGATHR